MEDSLGILVIFLIYLLAAVGDKKKKKKKPRTPMRSSAQGERHDPRKAERDRQTQRGFSAAFGGGRIQEQPAAVPVSVPVMEKSKTQPAPQRCTASFKAEKEKEDSFDEGVFAPLEESASDSPIYGQEIGREEVRQALAQDILRGVVMSEVLTRPRDRAAMQRSRRRI